MKTLADPRPERTKRESARIESAGGGRRLRVLVADDDPDVAALVAATLKRWRIYCMYAHDGATAIELARRLRPDVLVLDVRMPDLDGFGVLRLLKQDSGTRHIKIIILTSCKGPDDIMRAFRSGADDFVPKPFAPVDLATRVKMLGPW